MNRVLTHGEEACREEELLEIAPKLQRFDPKAWFEQWNMLARRAEAEGRLMHAAYYHRMSEFFLPEGTPEKANAYEDFSRCFYAAIRNGRKMMINAVAAVVRKLDDTVDWLITHGMYVTGTETPFDHLHEFMKYQTKDLSPLIEQDVLLLAGENDHFVPVEFLELQKAAYDGSPATRPEIIADVISLATNSNNPKTRYHAGTCQYPQKVCPKNR